MNARPNSISRRQLLIGGALGLTAAVGSALSFTTTAGPAIPPLDRVVPARIGPWSEAPMGGLSIPRGETPAGDAYDDLLTRLYTAPNATPIMLLIAYGATQSGNTQLHSPEDCYPNAGFDLQRWQDVPLRTPGAKPLLARYFTATAPGRIEQVLYWNRIGREYPMGFFDQRWSLLRQMTAGRIPDGVLVRISTINHDRSVALSHLRAFAVGLFAIRNAAMKFLLTGQS
jgi:EpsI family protein